MEMTNTSKAAAMVAAARKAYHAEVAVDRAVYIAASEAALAAYEGASADAANRLDAVYDAARLLAERDEV